MPGVDQSCHPGPVPRVGVLSSSNVEGEDFSQSAGSSLLLLGILPPLELFLHFLADIPAPTVDLPRYLVPLTTHQGSILVSQPAVDHLEMVLESPVSGELPLGHSRADRLAFEQLDTLVARPTFLTGTSQC